MSYCRWSSMNHGCDLYVFADVHGGYTCHVAKMKRVSDTPCPEMPEQWWKLPPDELLAIHQAQLAWCDQSKLEPIGLPHDGASFYNLPKAEMCETLAMLKREGYRMPTDLIEAIASEVDDE